MIIGHQKKVAQLQNFLNRGVLFPAFLFEGPEHTGKYTIAKEFIKGLNCFSRQFGGCNKCEACLGTHYDTMIIDESALTAYRDKVIDYDPYGIEGVDRIMHFAQTTPVRSGQKIVLIDNSHLLTREAQNKLLKILEEPPSYCAFILVSHKPDMLLETIHSRCLKMSFGLVSPQAIKDNPEFGSKQGADERLAQYSLGRPGYARYLSVNRTNVNEFKKQGLDVLKFLQTKFPENLSYIPKTPKTNESPVFDLLELFQIIGRDLLLYAYGAESSAMLLTRKQKIPDPKTIQQSLSISLRLADILEDAVSPATITRCFEYLAVKN